MIRTARDCSTRAWRAVRGAQVAKTFLAWNKWTLTVAKASAKSLHEAWHGWSAIVSKKHLVHAFITWMASRRNTALAKLVALNWRRNAVFTLRTRHRENAFLQSTGARRVRACFYRWYRRVMSNHTRTLQSLWERLERLDLLRWAIRDWCGSVHLRFRLQYCSARLLLRRSLRHAAHAAIHAWCQHVKKKSFLAKADGRLIKSLRLQMVASVLHMWSVIVSSRAHVHSLALAKRMPSKAEHTRRYFAQWRRTAAASRMVKSWSHRIRIRGTFLMWVHGIQTGGKRRTAGAILGRLRWRLTAAICRIMLRRWLVRAIRVQQVARLSRVIRRRVCTAAVVRILQGWLSRVHILAGVGSMVRVKRRGVLQACVTAWLSVMTRRKMRHAIVADLWGARAGNNSNGHGMAQGTPRATQRSNENYAHCGHVAMTRYSHGTSRRGVVSHVTSRVGAFQRLRTRNMRKITVDAMRRYTARCLRYKRHVRVCEGHVRRTCSSILVLAMSEWSSKSRAGDVCNKFNAAAPDNVLPGQPGKMAGAAAADITTAGSMNVIEQPAHTLGLVTLQNEQVCMYVCSCGPCLCVCRCRCAVCVCMRVLSFLEVEKAVLCMHLSFYFDRYVQIYTQCTQLYVWTSMDNMPLYVCVCTYVCMYIYISITTPRFPY
jgi:hypothetical protein